MNKCDCCGKEVAVSYFCGQEFYICKHCGLDYPNDIYSGKRKINDNIKNEVELEWYVRFVEVKI